MSVKRRLKVIEKITGRVEPKLMFFLTYYERKDGGEDFGSGRATVTNIPNYHRKHGPIVSREGETDEEFKARAQVEVCQAAGG